jgi:hypothetical protein
MPTAYEAREKSKQFAKQWQDALAFGVGRLEEVGFDWAEAGEQDWQWCRDSRGRLVKKALPSKKSAALLMFLLRAHKPEVYRDTVRQEHAGVPGQPINVTLVGVEEEDLPG